MQTRDYVHVSDVVRANLAAVGRPGFNIYNVGTGIETSVVDLYKEIARALGTDLQAQHGPAKQGEQQRSVVDGSLGRRELGSPAADPLERGAGADRGVVPGAGGAAGRGGDEVK